MIEVKMSFYSSNHNGSPFSIWTIISKKKPNYLVQKSISPISALFKRRGRRKIWVNYQISIKSCSTLIHTRPDHLGRDLISLNNIIAEFCSQPAGNPIKSVALGVTSQRANKFNLTFKYWSETAFTHMWPCDVTHVWRKVASRGDRSVAQFGRFTLPFWVIFPQ